MSHQHSHEDSQCPCCAHAQMHHAQESSCCGHHHHHHGDKDFSSQLLEMADEAWMEVLKEKIKEQILKSNGSHLDRLAKLVSDANGSRWKHKLGVNKILNDYKDQMTEFFKGE